MSDNILKKITIGILVPIFVSVVGWATWVTGQAFSAKQTEYALVEHRLEARTYRSEVQKKIDSLGCDVKKSFENLNSKIDKNTQGNNKILMDLQKQIGRLNCEQ